MRNDKEARGAAAGPPGTSDAREAFLVVMHSFALGGVASRYSTLVREASRQGARCTVIAKDGPAREVYGWGDADLMTVEEWDASSLDAVREFVGASSLILWAVTPDTAPLLPLVAGARRAVLGVHGYAALMEEWLGESAVTLLRAVLADNAHIGVVVPGVNYLAGVRDLLRISSDRCSWLPHAVALTGDRAPLSRPRGARTVLCPTRLSAEQRYLIRAAADFAEAGAAELTIVGTGKDVEWIHEHIEARPHLRATLVVDGEIASWIAKADVVVGVGLVALEAVAAACDVVTVSRGGGGGVLDVVSPETWDRQQGQNFFSVDEEPIAPAEAWRRVDLLSPEDRTALRHLVDTGASPAAALGILRVAGVRESRAGASSDTGTSLALARGWLAVRSEFEELRAWLPQVEEARDYFRERSERFEALLAEDDD